MPHSIKIAALAGLTLAALSNAHADTLTPVAVGGNLILSESWASVAAGQTPSTVTGTGTTGTGGIGISDLTASGAGSFQFSQTFNAPTGSFAAANTVNGNSYGFVASYVFSVTPSMASAYTFSLNLNSQVGLQNLSARLYEYSANGVQNLTLGGTGAVSSGMVDPWSASVNPTTGNPVASTTLGTTSLANGGEFVLEIIGIESGGQTGTYSGQLDITPVPLPAALPLLLSGLAGLGFLRRRPGTEA